MKLEKYKLITITAFVALLFVFFSCRKNPTAPPTATFAYGSAVTIQQLRSSWTGISTKITSNTTLYAVVTADEVSGQLYKQVYIRDNSGTYSQTHNYGAISLHFLNTSNGVLYVGDSIAINLNGCWLDLSGGGSLQIDSIPHATFPVIQKIPGGVNPKPILVNIPQLNTYQNGHFIYDAQLVQLDSVEFIQPNVGTTYATPQSFSVNVSSVPPVNVNKYICDFKGNAIVAYNSGYSNFAGQTIPANSGTITAIANLYNSMQLSIRSYCDMSWSPPLGNALNCAQGINASYVPIVYDTITQNFGSVLPSRSYNNVGLSKNSSCANMPGWQTVDLLGNLFWEGSQYGNYPDYAYAPSVSNYKTQSPTGRNDIWLISPRIVDASVAVGANYTKKMDFSSSYPFATTTSNHSLLSVLVSRTYDGTHVIPSQWTDISSSTVAPFHNINTTAGSAANFQYAHNQTYSTDYYDPFLVAFTLQQTIPATNYFYVAFRYQSNALNPDSTGATIDLGTLILKN